MNEQKMESVATQLVCDALIAAVAHSHDPHSLAAAMKEWRAKAEAFTADPSALSTKQQAVEPVAWVRHMEYDSNGEKDAWVQTNGPFDLEHLAANTPLYTAPQLPRDVLMRVAEAVREAVREAVASHVERWDDGPYMPRIDLAAIVDAALPGVEQPALAVWYGSMPETNGKSNWTAILHNGDIADGFTIARSEYPDRVRYEADCVRHLIGELEKAPFILDYDSELHSDYIDAGEQPQAVGVPDGWRDLAARCLVAMESAVQFSSTGIGRPPSQTCLFEIEELRAMLAAAPKPEGGEA